MAFVEASVGKEDLLKQIPEFLVSRFGPHGTKKRLHPHKHEDPF